MRDIGILTKNLQSVADSLDKKNGKGFVRSYLELTRKEYNKFLALENAPFHLVMQNLYKLGISVDALSDGVVDTGCVENYINNNRHVPVRYKKEARSKWLVTQNILKEVKEKYGEFEYRQLLFYLQLSPEYLEPKFSDNYISTELNRDIYKYIKRYLGGNRQTLYDLGAKIYNQYVDTDFAKSFKGLSRKQTYEKLLEEVVNHVEESYYYTLDKLTNDKAVIHKRLRSEVKEGLKSRSYGSKEVCEYSIGFASSILYHSNSAIARTEETRCVYDGSDYCEYVVHFDRPIVC